MPCVRNLTASELVGRSLDERSMDLGRTATAAMTARRWLDAEVTDLALSIDDAALDTARLLLSELVANVHLHTRSNAFASIAVHDDRLVVVVSDDDPTIPSPRDSGDLHTSGRGLRVVAELALDWGAVALAGGGKAIWFTLAV
jgi:hypothetical protein